MLRKEEKELMSKAWLTLQDSQVDLTVIRQSVEKSGLGPQLAPMFGPDYLLVWAGHRLILIAMMGSQTHQSHPDNFQTCLIFIEMITPLDGDDNSQSEKDVYQEPESVT